MRTTGIKALLAAALVAASMGSFAQNQAQEGRKVIAAVGPAVVTILLVKKSTMAYEGRSSSRESKAEVPGVVIEGNGLTVTSLSAGDPSATYQGGAGDGMSSRSEITDVKLLLGDGTEVPAKVVLRDKDLDLMFIRPVAKPSSPMASVDLNKAGELGLLDCGVIVTRLGKVVNRTLGGRLVAVQGIVAKPRKRYVVQSDMFGGDFGSPVFGLDGRVIGLLGIKMTQGGPDMSDGPRGFGDAMATVIIPASDIIKAAAQAPENAPKAKAPTTPPTKPATGKGKTGK